MLAMHDSKHRTTDTQIHDNRKDGSGYSSNKREWNLQTHGYNEDTSNHRKYMRIHSSSNNRVTSSSSTQQNGEKKTVKDAKKPIRVSGEWSEFKSSTGKTYFYNCKTEVSQWEKPKGWPSDEPSRTSTSSTSTANRIKKESISEKKLVHTSNVKSTSEHSNLNGNSKIQQTLQSNQPLPVTSNNRLPTSDDDNSRMSFSSTSSKESSLVMSSANKTNQSNGVTLNSSLSESISTSVCDIPTKNHFSGNENKSSKSQSTHPSSTSTESTPTTENESNTGTISKAEREQDIQKYYRAELIQHLTDWPSAQSEKQCLKLFDEYYGYSAKMSTAFIELKALKSNFRILEIKRNILNRRLLLCQRQLQQIEEDKYS